MRKSRARLQQGAQKWGWAFANDDYRWAKMDHPLLASTSIIVYFSQRDGRVINAFWRDGTGKYMRINGGVKAILRLMEANPA